MGGFLSAVGHGRFTRNDALACAVIAETGVISRSSKTVGFSLRNPTDTDEILTRDHANHT